MIPALFIIEEKLKETGMDQIDIDHLMARFLEEEAFAYVECVKEFEIRNSKNIIDKVIIH